MSGGNLQFILGGHTWGVSLRLGIACVLSYGDIGMQNRGSVVSCMSFVCVIMFECIHLILRYDNFESRRGVT